MPQLQGPEQQELHGLMVQHIGSAQLARVLNFQGLPELEQLASNGTLRDQTEEVIDALSRRYLVLPLVEGALKELDGSCPPLDEWLKQHRTEMERRKSHPTLGERLEDFRQRVSLVPILIGAAALLAAFGVVLVPMLLREPTVVGRIYDANTGERILSPFTISYGEITRESVGTQCYLPESVVGEIDRVSAEGYIHGKPDIERVDNGEDAHVKLLLRRDHSNNNFLNSILPDFSSVVGLPTDEHIRVRMERNDQPPQEVTFLVKNETDDAVDLLLYYMPPSGHPDATNPFLARTQLIDEIAPRTWSEPFDKFQLKAGYFAIFASHSGKDARLVTSDAFYQAPWTVLYLTRIEDNPVGRLEFVSSDPRTP